MHDVEITLRRIEDALKWRAEWQQQFGDARDMASVRLWSDGSGVVHYKDQDLISFNNWGEFRERAENLIAEKRRKTNLERAVFN